MSFTSYLRQCHDRLNKKNILLIPQMSSFPRKIAKTPDPRQGLDPFARVIELAGIPHPSFVPLLLFFSWRKKRDHHYYQISRLTLFHLTFRRPPRDLKASKAESSIQNLSMTGLCKQDLFTPKKQAARRESRLDLPGVTGTNAEEATNSRIVAKRSF